MTKVLDPTEAPEGYEAFVPKVLDYCHECEVKEDGSRCGDWLTGSSGCIPDRRKDGQFVNFRKIVPVAAVMPNHKSWGTW